MTLIMKNGRARCPPKLKTLTYYPICVKNNFFPASIKNDNEAVTMRKRFVKHKQDHQLRQFLKSTTYVNRRPTDLCPHILVFILIKLKVFHITQNETPKMEKNRLYQQVVTKNRGTCWLFNSTQINKLSSIIYLAC